MMRFYTNTNHVNDLLNKLDSNTRIEIIDLLGRRFNRLSSMEVYTAYISGYMFPKEVELLEDKVNTGIVSFNPNLIYNVRAYVREFNTIIDNS